MKPSGASGPASAPGEIPETVLGTFEAADGTVIRYAAWPPAPGPKAAPEGNDRGAAAVLFLNGRSEFMEKHLETVSDLHGRGFTVYTFDWRGQGLSTRALPNRRKGYVKSYDQYLADLFQFVDSIVAPRHAGALYLLGHSMGSHLGLRFLHDRPGVIDKAVLVAPFLGPNSDPLPPGLLKAAMRAATAVGLGRRYLLGTGDAAPGRAAYSGNPLTSDPDRFAVEDEWLARNPDLGLGGPTYGWFDASFRSLDILHQPGYAEAIATPVLLVAAGRDRIVSTVAAREYRLRLPQGRYHVLSNALHEILHERDNLRDAFWKSFDDFLGST